jgi:hypothetical protein
MMVRSILPVLLAMIGFGCSSDANSPVEVMANGELCSTAEQCASGICEANKIDETHCYGNGVADDVCVDTYDCRVGLCLPRSLLGSEKACVPGVVVCHEKGVSEQCLEFVIDRCRLIQACGSMVSSAIPPSYASFDQCVGSECTGAKGGTGDPTPAECLAGTQAILSGTAACP